jgi:hypothetical protein
MNWQTITVQQFQDLYRVSIDKNLSAEDKSIKTIAIIYNMTEDQVEDMDLIEFKRLCAVTVNVLNIASIPGKPETRIGNYKVIYNPAKFKHRQSVEINNWLDSPIENMHLIMASLVVPVKYHFFTSANRAENHLRYADDILQQPIAKVYHACVFFCDLYRAFAETTAAHLENNNKATMSDKMKAELLRMASDRFVIKG